MRSKLRRVHPDFDEMLKRESKLHKISTVKLSKWIADIANGNTLELLHESRNRRKRR